ncbi:hypothetical protein [Wenyingzhuangia sp. IMCC45574]
MRNVRPTPRRLSVLNSEVKAPTQMEKSNVYVMDLKSFVFKVSKDANPGWRKSM